MTRIPAIFKISKGEESYFIWSIFYTLLEQVIAISTLPNQPNEKRMSSTG